MTIAWRIHLFSFRTQKLSFSAPKVLVGWLTGRIGRCHIPFNTALCGVFYLYQRKPRDSRVVQKSLTVDLYFIFWDCRVVYNAAFLLHFYYTFLSLFYAKTPQAKHVAFVFYYIWTAWLIDLYADFCNLMSMPAKNKTRRQTTVRFILGWHSKGERISFSGIAKALFRNVLWTTAWSAPAMKIRPCLR